MRRIASLAGVSLIAGGITALVMFASAARGAPLDLPLLGGGGDDIALQQTGSNGSGTESTTTSTTTGGNGSGVTTSSTAPTASTSSTAPSTASSTSTTRGAALPSTDGPTGTTCSTPPRITATVQSIVRGGSTGIGGTCFARNTAISLTLFSDPVNLGTVTSDANGNFSVTVTVPRSVPVGAHTLTAAGAGQSASMTLLVSEALARTGMSWNLAILGLVLIAAGIIVMAGDRIGRQELIAFD